MKKRSNSNPPQAPPGRGGDVGGKSNTVSRPYAFQPTPTDYKGATDPKLSQADIVKIARREGEVLKAHGVTSAATKQEMLEAKRAIEPPPPAKQTPSPVQQAPAQPAPTPQVQKKSYNFSEKAKAFFQKYTQKNKDQPQKEQEQTKTKPKEKDRDR